MSNERFRSFSRLLRIIVGSLTDTVETFSCSLRQNGAILAEELVHLLGQPCSETDAFAMKPSGAQFTLNEELLLNVIVALTAAVELLRSEI